MIISHIILATAWILYCVLHSVLASSKFKQTASDKMRRQYKFYRLYYTVFAFAGFVLVLFYQITIPSYRIFIPNTVSLVLGIIIAFSGLLIMTICILKYFMQLSGLKGLIENRTSNELMITGIHKIVRHPLYAGTFVFIWGLVVIFPLASLLIADTIITVYTLIGLRFEEMKLEKEFGEAYRLYKQKVPMIIPKLIK
jgi:methanethiol S-methyltransferase